MKQIHRSCRALALFAIGVGAALLAHGAPPAVAPLAPSLAERIDAVIAQPRFAAASWGAAVISLDTGKSVYTHAADKLFTPASTAKLFTAALALDVLGPDHRVATSLFATAKAGRDGELRGDLVLVGYGDPMLGFDKRVSWADTLAIALRKTGVTAVRGDLIADATWFAAPTYGHGWEAADLQSWFGVPASALSVDDNVVRIEISPAVQVGGNARVRFDPPSSAPELDNRVYTVAAHGITDISLVRAPGDAILHAFGSIARDAEAQTYRIAVADPALVAATQLRAALLRQGVSVSGKLRSVYWPRTDEALAADTLQRIADVESPSVEQIVQRGLKVSQNLYMQNLLLMVGAKASADERASGTEALQFRSAETRGIDALKRFVASIGISPDSVLIEDGAGLSRRNLTSPNALAALLVHEGSAPAAAAFRLALPEAGVDGSLTGRMRGSPAQGRVHAKTGSMNFTYALAGYVLTAANERLAFALMLNNYHPVALAEQAVRPSAELDAIAIILASMTERSEPAAPLPSTP